MAEWKLKLFKTFESKFYLTPEKLFHLQLIELKDKLTFHGKWSSLWISPNIVLHFVSELAGFSQLKF
jgi:hypothetical protein